MRRSAFTLILGLGMVMQTGCCGVRSFIHRMSGLDNGCVRQCCATQCSATDTAAMQTYACDEAIDKLDLLPPVPPPLD
jgi:hypothetical protein